MFSEIYNEFCKEIENDDNTSVSLVDFDLYDDFDEDFDEDRYYCGLMYEPLNFY